MICFAHFQEHLDLLFKRALQKYESRRIEILPKIKYCILCTSPTDKEKWDVDAHKYEPYLCVSCVELLPCRCGKKKGTEHHRYPGMMQYRWCCGEASRQERKEVQDTPTAALLARAPRDDRRPAHQVRSVPLRALEQCRKKISYSLNLQ